MYRMASYAPLVGLLVACGASEESSKGSVDSTDTSATGSTTGVAGASHTSSSTTSGSTGGAGGGASSSASVVTTGSGGVSAGGASTGTGGNGVVVCGDVACGPPLRATVVPSAQLAHLSEASIHICVDDWCASGTFPAFTLDGISGYVNEASFVTDPIDEGAGRGGYFVEAYTDYDKLVISHESVIGEEFSVEITADEMVLTRVSGRLTANTIESACLTCTTYTFVNLPE